MKVIIPVAGGGTRLKPHTLSTPKQLLKVAGAAMLDYVIQTCEELEPDEMIFIVGTHKEQIIEHIENNFSHIPYSFVEQKVRNGDGAAIFLGLESIIGEEDDDVFILFGDTLIDFDIQQMVEDAKGKTGSVACQKVENPTQYGVVELDKKNNIIGLEEKPSEPKTDLAVIGAYYFDSFKLVHSMLKKNIEEQKTMKGEYRIAQVVLDLALDKSKNLDVYVVDKWFDCGRASVLLDANNYFLEENSQLLSAVYRDDNCIVIPPCFISKTAQIKNSIIGPYVSIDEGCKIENSHISHSIISSRTTIDFMHLDWSLVSHDVFLRGKSKKINIGEKCEVEFS